MEKVYNGSTTALRVVRSDGAQMEFTTGGGEGWRIAYEGLKDWLDLPIQITTSPNVLTNGSSVVGKRIDECERTAVCIYGSQGSLKDARNEALTFFNPTFTFSAYVTYYGVTRWAPGELSAVSCEITKEGQALELTFSLLCPDPFLRSQSGNENYLTDAVPMFGFPYVSHVKAPTSNGTKYPAGFLAGKLIFDGKNTIYNSGDVETTYTIKCQFDGTVTNPVFTKDDKFVKMLATYNDGDELVIDFTQAPPVVEVNGNNAIQACSRDSNFTGMQMQVGPNVFDYACENSENRPYMNVQILFWKKYLGI